VEAAEVLSGVEGVALCRFTDADVVRHPLVQRLVQAYERLDTRSLTGSAKKRFHESQAQTEK
jgi:phosphate starvation-inducible PhoH-like protein